MKRQSITTQKGEIEFRKKLSEQHIKGESLLSDEFDKEKIENILKGRMDETHHQMKTLKENNVPITPYIEIGAERCQRSLVMENDLEAAGAAVDISYDMLKSCDYYKSIFIKSKTPLRICCDAHNLPFKSNTIPFVFCYETLHHFPDPSPIIKEIYRVLSPGGNFLFNEEPYKNILHINLYKGEKEFSEINLTKSKIKKLFDHFFKELSCNEIEYNIIENYGISASNWKKMLSIFKERGVKLASLKGMTSDLFNPDNLINHIITCLIGGTIHGVCSKAGKASNEKISIKDILICPECHEKGSESVLAPKYSSFLCNECGNEFTIINGVTFLFTENKFKDLYPEIFAGLQSRLE